MLILAHEGLIDACHRLIERLIIIILGRSRSFTSQSFFINYENMLLVVFSINCHRTRALVLPGTSKNLFCIGLDACSFGLDLVLRYGHFDTRDFVCKVDRFIHKLLVLMLLLSKFLVPVAVDFCCFICNSDCTFISNRALLLRPNLTMNLVRVQASQTLPQPR